VSLSDASSRARGGVPYALGAYLIWGTFPLYWRALVDVPSDQLLAHRIFWSAVLMVLVTSARACWWEVKASWKNSRERLRLIYTALLVSSNWWLYMWAVNTGRVLEASLGYFMNPLLNVFLGHLVLGERLLPLQRVAVLLAMVGLGLRAYILGSLPWISVMLAITFTLYGLERKRMATGPLTGLTLESLVLAVPALAWLAVAEARGLGFLTEPPAWRVVMLVGTGLATAVPLMFFAVALRRLSYSTLGFIQYLSPTCQFLLGVFWFHEGFSVGVAIGFVCVWVALALYLTALWKASIIERGYR
jgi:chloramphenicol-sensitive protein RarD